MAKEKEKTPVQKGTSTFNLIGVAALSDYTFKIDEESTKEDSDWVYNQMRLNVDCGEKSGKISCELMGGYGTSRENKVFVHGIKKDDNNNDVDDFKNKFEVAWEDRFNEEVLATIGERCFIKVALETKNDKTVYAKFLTPYDAIEYIKEHLKEDMVINVKGNIVWSIYKEEIQFKKEVTSIALSKAKPEDYKAVFSQTLILDSDCIGKLNKEERTIPITARIVEYFKEWDGKLTKAMLPVYKTFDLIIGADKEKANKMLKIFKAKSKEINTLTVDGIFTRGSATEVEVDESMIPEDILELIELGYLDKDEVIGKMAFANGGNKKPEVMLIKAPKLKFVGEGTKLPVIDKVVKAYTEADLNMEELIEAARAKLKSQKGGSNDLDEALDNEEDEDDEEDWLKDLDD